MDIDLLEWFRDHAHAAGGGNYQTMINDALRSYVENQSPTLEKRSAVSFATSCAKREPLKQKTFTHLMRPE